MPSRWLWRGLTLSASKTLLHSLKIAEALMRESAAVLGSDLVLCLINPLTNSEPRRRLSPPLAKGDLGGFFSAGGLQIPLAPFFKGGIRKNR